MDFRQAEEYLLSFTDYEKVPGIAYTAANYDLRRMELLLEPLGQPHLSTKTVHIAGTKGKGSTAAMVSSILTAAGYRTGLYTSPHLLTIRERASINGQMISEEEFAELVTQIRPIVEKVNGDAEFGQLTTFEILTAVVFTFFKRHGIDFQVLEVGLGGRLDATNVARGDVCIITSISLDHTAVLGDSLEKIAAEKAGIIKGGSIVVNFPQAADVMRVIRETCKRQKAILVQVGEDITWMRSWGDISVQWLMVKGQYDDYNIGLPLLGDFQMENAAAAVAVAEALIGMGLILPKEQIEAGLNRVSWPGRLQVIAQNPCIILDGAHNAYSMRQLILSIRKYFNFVRCIVIFGSSLDKDIRGMAAELADFTRDVIITSSTHPRAAAKGDIIAAFETHGVSVREAGTVDDAVSAALDQANKDDLILVTGSLFIVAEALRHFTV
ncbi:MAG TPA: folylpolyglutamate synthase/dihydrofolate synthase family protein [Dehalococcoidia bacterium]|nr:folylpolyglutamate synthase/dihydrofolate synthase family protein [Dehalococcoidia bacterium]